MTMLVYRPKAVAYPAIVAQAATGEVNKVTCRGEIAPASVFRVGRVCVGVRWR